MQKLAGVAVEHVEECVAIGVQHQCRILPWNLASDQHRRFGGVPIVRVVRRELEIPLQLSRLRIERQDAARVKIVARAHGTVVVGRRIAGGPEQRVGIARRKCRSST